MLPFNNEQTPCSQPNTLVFSIALNGYQYLYRNHLKSHREYALRHGYMYEAVTRPVVTHLGVECCWLKLTLLLRALRNGYQHVMFVDADAFIHTRAPQITDTMFEHASVLMAKSYSGRYNSGVIMIKNHGDSLAWLKSIINKQSTSIDQKNSVGWGENGHIIEQSKKSPCVGEVDIKWNNTYQKNLTDYITHFSHGPLRQGLTMRLIHKALSRLTNYYSKITNIIFSDKNAAKELARLTHQVSIHYPTFQK